MHESNLLPFLISKSQKFRPNTISIDSNHFAIQTEIPLSYYTDTGRLCLNTIIEIQNSLAPYFWYHLRIWFHRIFQTIKTKMTNGISTYEKTCEIKTHLISFLCLSDNPVIRQNSGTNQMGPVLVPPRSERSFNFEINIGCFKSRISF